MVAVADTGFIVSLYLKETTSATARAAIESAPIRLTVTPLILLEMRNALNRAIHRQRISFSQRDSLWKDIETDFANDFLISNSIAFAEVHQKAQELSDLYTPAFGARSLDLLHVATAVILQADLFFSFDERQRQAAKKEGLKIKPH